MIDDPSTNRVEDTRTHVTGHRGPLVLALFMIVELSCLVRCGICTQLVDDARANAVQSNLQQVAPQSIMSVTLQPELFIP